MSLCEREYPIPPHTQDAAQGQFSKQNLTGLNT